MPVTAGLLNFEDIKGGRRGENGEAAGDGGVNVRRRGTVAQSDAGSVRQFHLNGAIGFGSKETEPGVIAGEIEKRAGIIFPVQPEIKDVASEDF